MSQFYFENKIDFRAKDFVNMTAAGANIFGKAKLIGKDTLIPVGGGKDSAVSLEVLNDNLDRVGAMILTSINVRSNMNPSLLTAKKAGVKKIHIVERVFDPELLVLNKKGFLNGHTPFSAYLAFLSISVAYIFNYKYIAFSNERSSNEGNVRYLGHEVNHQYSKTFEFENDFRKYSMRYLSNTNYFSFLRPLYEIQISKIFAKYSKYFKIIRSCNVGQLKGIWCCECPKCLSTFMLLYPFLGVKITKIFPYNLYENEKLKPIIRSLTSKYEIKPFECVGTKEEIKIALDWKSKKSEFNNIMKTWNNKNNLPPNFKRILRDEVYE